MVNGAENNIVPKSTLNVGVLTPPNALHKPQLYSDRAAESQFRQISHDIYKSENSQKFENKRKTPLSVILTLVAAAATTGIIVFKKMMKW